MGLGVAIPPFPGWQNDFAGTIGTALAWGEASVLITCGDIIATNTYNNSKSKSVGQSSNKKKTPSNMIIIRITQGMTTADYFRQQYNRW